MEKLKRTELARRAIALCKFDEIPLTAYNIVDALDELGYLVDTRTNSEYCSCGASINANIVLGDGVIRCTVCRKPRR
jgi:hypothetical protein